MAQAFDRVSHQGVMHKLNYIFPKCICNVLKLYLENIIFCVSCKKEYSEIKPVNAGIPHRSVLGPLYYLIYSKELHKTEETKLVTFADDTAF